MNDVHAAGDLLFAEADDGVTGLSEELVFENVAGGSAFADVVVDFMPVLAVHFDDEIVYDEVGIRAVYFYFALVLHIARGEISNDDSFERGGILVPPVGESFGGNAGAMFGDERLKAFSSGGLE